MGTNKIDLERILTAAVDALSPFCHVGEGGNLVTEDLDWEAWPQCWGSTALGYGGIGGQAITHAQTVIVSSLYCREVAVFFGRPRLAYVAHSDSPGYQKAYQNRNFPPCNRAATVRN